jgi:beta-lactamase regulating signal transducer with metallopeptidase domain
MTAEIALSALVRINLVASAAILLVLALRPWILRWFDSRLTYWLWLIVPLATTASLLPRPQLIEFIEPSSVVYVDENVSLDSSVASSASASAAAPARVDRNISDFAALLLAVWLTGAIGLFSRSVVSTRRFGSDPIAGPALVGIFRPKLVLPADFRRRFTDEERSLILAHEDQHRRSGHPTINALVEIARCACWFNPLAHLASRRFRIDQELACDAMIIAAHPTKRRVYAEALLKTRIVPRDRPLVCTWTSRSAQSLGERITMLGRPSLRLSRALIGVFLLAVINLALGYTAWAQQPERRVYEVARPAAVWTPSSEAPAGTLSHELEGRRHDFFIELAQAGDIDLLFFGTTDTEMWWWKRGREIWNREYGSIKAANFGSQGTQPRSLLWRMRNGELDGFDAKLIVLQAWGIIGADNGADYADGFIPIIAEVRSRQPQARLLLMAPLPRGMARFDRWRQQAASYDAAMASLADNKSVFYANFGDRFFNEDGSFKRETWSGGRQGPGFEIWAEALQPWLERFVY